MKLQQELKFTIELNDKEVNDLHDQIKHIENHNVTLISDSPLAKLRDLLKSAWELENASL